MGIDSDIFEEAHNYALNKMLNEASAYAISLKNIEQMKEFDLEKKTLYQHFLLRITNRFIHLAADYIDSKIPISEEREILKEEFGKDILKQFDENKNYIYSQNFLPKN
jgi:hypothetical protein